MAPCEGCIASQSSLPAILAAFPRPAPGCTVGFRRQSLGRGLVKTPASFEFEDRDKVDRIISFVLGAFRSIESTLAWVLTQLSIRARTGRSIRKAIRRRADSEPRRRLKGSKSSSSGNPTGPMSSFEMLTYEPPFSSAGDRR
jgi:hypothetical protein